MDIDEDGAMWLFTLSNIIQDVGTLYQIYHSEYIKKNTECVSIDTQIMFLISTITRAIWVYDTELKDFLLSNIELIVSFIIHLYFIVYVIVSREEKVLTQLFAISKRFWERWFVIIIFSFSLGFLVHPSSYYHYRRYLKDIQMCIAFSIYTDAGSLIPQLPILWREGDVGSVSRTYIVFLFIARCFRIAFWFIWSEGFDFKCLLIADIIYLMCVCIFVFSFCGNVNKMILPIKNN